MRNYDHGFAFICEGDTEKEFYLSMLDFLCRKYGATMSKIYAEQNPEILYELTFDGRCRVIKFYIAQSITGIPRAGKWFEAECVSRYDKDMPWTAFLCYDLDAYVRDITLFYQDDWADLRKKLVGAEIVIDLAAAADIEDILLTDVEGVCTFLGHPMVKVEDVPGRKGSSKMKHLFRDCGRGYHKGGRARQMIDSLDMQKIIDHSVLELSRLEKILFPV